MAVLEVELWGRFHEYEYGYVAAVQLVRRAMLLPYCVCCLFSRARRLRAACVLGRARGNTKARPALRGALDTWGA